MAITIRENNKRVILSYSIFTLTAFSLENPSDLGYKIPTIIKYSGLG